jgi:hypothetical protein
MSVKGRASADGEWDEDGVEPMGGTRRRASRQREG